MQVGDLVRLKKNLNFAPDIKNLLGVIVDIRQIKSDDINRKRGVILGMEYKVSIITNNKAAWYIHDSLELVNEGRRPSKK